MNRDRRFSDEVLRVPVVSCATLVAGGPCSRPGDVTMIYRGQPHPVWREGDVRTVCPTHVRLWHELGWREQS